MYINAPIYIFNISANEIIDHKNRNPMDNCKSNLRIATKKGNAVNSGVFKNNFNSKHKNVYFKKGRKRPYQVSLIDKGKHIFGGTFTNKKEAVHAANELRREYQGEFAYHDPYADEPEPEV